MKNQLVDFVYEEGKKKIKTKVSEKVINEGVKLILRAIAHGIYICTIGWVINLLYATFHSSKKKEMVRFIDKNTKDQT